MDTKNLMWFAGFLEGEGCFIFSKSAHNLRISVGQKQKWPLELCHKLFGGTICFEKRGYWRWNLVGKKAVSYMFMVYSLMSPERKERIRSAIVQWKSVKPSQANRLRCAKGHLLSGENLAIRGNFGGKRIGRRCKACERQWTMNWKNKSISGGGHSGRRGSR
jgi:hypothetical protein